MRLPRLEYSQLAMLAVIAVGTAIVLGRLGIETGFDFHAVLLYGVTIIVVVMGAGYWAWRQSERLQATLDELIAATDRISHGDFTHGIDSSPHGRFGALQHAFEQMRLALRQTTFTTNYLHSVLNSMADAVFVTAPDGTIRMANGAAQRLTGYTEEELMSCSVVTLLDRADGPPTLLFLSPQSCRCFPVPRTCWSQ